MNLNSYDHKVQWLRGRASDSRLRGLGFEFRAVVLKPWASFFSLHCSSSPSCINEYLAIDSGGFVYEQPSRCNCSIWLDACQTSSDGIWLNRSVREVSVKALWAVLRTGYLPFYIHKPIERCLEPEKHTLHTCDTHFKDISMIFEDLFGLFILLLVPPIQWYFHQSKLGFYTPKCWADGSLHKAMLKHNHFSATPQLARHNFM